MLQPTLHAICNGNSAGQTLLVVTAEDLREFARDIAREVRQQNEPQYFSRKELLDYLGCCSRTLWGYEDAGIITADMVGGKKLYDKTAIFAAIKEGRLKKPIKK